jgi:HAMP domain-containing protein
LRSKLLISFVFLIAGLTIASLLVLRHNAEAQVQQEMERDARNATLTFQTVQRQEQTALSRKADLLASLAFMRNGDASAITDASEDPWQSEDCSLFALGDRSGKIVALHSTGPSLPLESAQELVSLSVKRGETWGWWFANGALYQVVLHPFDDGSPERNLLGTVIVGHWMDARAAGNLGRIASGQVVFRHGDDVAVSTLSPFREMEFARQARGPFETTQLRLDNERFYARALELTPGLQPMTQFIVLKSYAEAEAYLRRLNHLLLGVGLVAILLGGVLIFFISDTVTRPLASLVYGVHALERGDYKYPLETSGHDELSQLTLAFDGMRRTLLKNRTQREQLEGQLRQSQKMAGWRAAWPTTSTTC